MDIEEEEEERRWYCTPNIMNLIQWSCDNKNDTIIIIVNSSYNKEICLKTKSFVETIKAPVD